MIGPIVLLALAVTILAAIGLKSAVRQSDELSVARQTREVELALSAVQDDLAQSQSGVAIWNLALIELRRPHPDWSWFDSNIGEYLNYVFSHQADFILDGHDRPVYATMLGKQVSPDHYDQLAATLRPMVDAVRGRTHLPPNPHERFPGGRVHPHSTARTSPRSVHATDLVLLAGHPAAVSVMRMIPDTPAVKDTPGAEPLMICIRFLDAGFSRDLSQLKLIDAARIASHARTAAGERAIPLLSSRGGRIGYFIWRPELPGSALLASMAPVATGAVSLLIFALALLAVRLVKMMRANVDALAKLESAHADLTAKEVQAQYRAMHDSLTGLPNRPLFIESLERALRNCDADHPLAIMLLDLDRFKQVNDTLGHHAGDLLIQEVAERLRDTIGPEDVAARLGGDEFALLVRSCSNETDLRQMAVALTRILDQPFHLGDSKAFVGVSIGIIRSEGHSGDRSELMRRADLAMYRAKEDGRGGFCFFTGDMEDRVLQRSALEHDLREALVAGDQLFVEYQPRISSGEHKVVGFEALLRWRHPTKGLIPPQAFIPIAEETGLIEEIGLWVLERAAQVARDWPFLSFAVNLSPVQLRDPTFPDGVNACVAQAGTAPRQIEFEVTEGLLLADDPVSIAALARLRNDGFEISLDDFGTGYSSLNYLTRFKVDKIKIDRSFIERLSRSPEAAAIICAVVALGRAMGLTVAAEGVETAEQRDFLSVAGCDELQGFFFSPGITEEKIGPYLESLGPGRITSIMHPKASF